MRDFERQKATKSEFYCEGEKIHAMNFSPRLRSEFWCHDKSDWILSVCFFFLCKSTGEAKRTEMSLRRPPRGTITNQLQNRKIQPEHWTSHSSPNICLFFISWLVDLKSCSINNLSGLEYHWVSCACVRVLGGVEPINEEFSLLSSKWQNDKLLVDIKYDLFNNFNRKNWKCSQVMYEIHKVLKHPYDGLYHFINMTLSQAQLAYYLFIHYKDKT